MLNYYHRFVPHCAAVLAPLQNILRHAASDDVSAAPDLAAAVQAAKAALVDATLLAHPLPQMDLHLHVDASSEAVSGALHQVVDGVLQPLAFFSRKLNPAQFRYSTFAKELTAMYLAIKYFRHFVEGSSLTLTGRDLLNIDLCVLMLVLFW